MGGGRNMRLCYQIWRDFVMLLFGTLSVLKRFKNRRENEDIFTTVRLFHLEERNVERGAGRGAGRRRERDVFLMRLNTCLAVITSRSF